MKIRLGLVMFGVALLVIGAGLAVYSLGPTHRITQENIARITEGMSEAEVVEILGAPAGDYARSSKTTFINVPFMGVGWPGPGEKAIDFFTHNYKYHAKEWIGDEAGARIWFDEKGHVFAVTLGLTIRYEITPWERFRQWLGI